MQRVLQEGRYLEAPENQLISLTEGRGLSSTDASALVQIILSHKELIDVLGAIFVASLDPGQRFRAPNIEEIVLRGVQETQKSTFENHFGQALKKVFMNDPKAFLAFSKSFRQSL